MPAAKKASPAHPTLRRYTQLPSLIYLLQQKKLTLLDPATWDDRNDSYYLALYKEKKKLQTVLALCLSEAPETYHHWHVFAPTSGGVCITFKRDALLKLAKGKGMKAREVRYMTIESSKKAPPKVSELPFLKRSPYEPEREFRLLFESKSEKLPVYNLPLDLDCIERVTLSPWLNQTLADELRRVLRAIPGCENLGIARSTLISNEQWKKIGDEAVASGR